MNASPVEYGTCGSAPDDYAQMELAALRSEPERMSWDFVSHIFAFPEAESLSEVGLEGRAIEGIAKSG
jgi:hypothetical protein